MERAPPEGCWRLMRQQTPDFQHSHIVIFLRTITITTMTTSTILTRPDASTTTSTCQNTSTAISFFINTYYLQTRRVHHPPPPSTTHYHHPCPSLAWTRREQKRRTGPNGTFLRRFGPRWFLFFSLSFLFCYYFCIIYYTWNSNENRAATWKRAQTMWKLLGDFLSAFLLITNVLFILESYYIWNDNKKTVATMMQDDDSSTLATMKCRRVFLVFFKNYVCGQFYVVLNIIGPLAVMRRRC